MSPQMRELEDFEKSERNRKVPLENPAIPGQNHLNSKRTGAMDSKSSYQGLYPCSPPLRKPNPNTSVRGAARIFCRSLPGLTFILTKPTLSILAHSLLCSGEKKMRSSLTFSLYSVVGLLSFYVGYVGFGVARACVCNTPSTCNSASCSQMVSPVCFNLSGENGQICDTAPSGTCQSCPLSAFNCQGRDQNGNICWASTPRCNGPCPPP